MDETLEQLLSADYCRKYKRPEDNAVPKLNYGLLDCAASLLVKYGDAFVHNLAA